jgi:hypothetical protein
MARKKLTADTEHQIFIRSGRRCALCWGLEQDLGVKQIQIAHIDRDRTNNNPSNLAALCLPHHDTYDTTPRQTKKLTAQELSHYRDVLYDIIEKRRGIITSKVLDSNGLVSQTKGDTRRLGLLVEAYDEDSDRERPNGISLLNLIKRFALEEGDFLATQEGVKFLLRLIRRENKVYADGSVYLLRSNPMPISSPLVSLIKLLIAVSRIDGSAYWSLVGVVGRFGFSGESRRNGLLDDAELPNVVAASVCTLLYVIAAGTLEPCEKWASEIALRELRTLVCRVSIAYALEGYSIPERIVDGDFKRSAEIDSDGTDEDKSAVSKSMMPQVWYACIEVIGRLPPSVFSQMRDNFRLKLRHREENFRIGTSGNVQSFKTTIKLVDYWTCELTSIMGGHIQVANEKELASILEYVSQQRAKAELALRHLLNCLICCHRRIWNLPESPE